MSLAMEEFLDIDFGERSQSLSERYRKDSLLWLCTKLAWRMRPDPGLAMGSSGLRPDDVPLSTSKLGRQNNKTVSADVECDNWTTQCRMLLRSFSMRVAHFQQRGHVMLVTGHQAFFSDNSFSFHNKNKNYKYN